MNLLATTAAQDQYGPSIQLHHHGHQAAGALPLTGFELAALIAAAAFLIGAGLMLRLFRGAE